MIGGPASDINTHISAITSLSVYELWGSASQGTEQAAVALLRKGSIIDSVQAAASVEADILGHELGGDHSPVASHIRCQIVGSLYSLNKGLNAG